MSDAVKCVVWDLDGTVWPGVAIEMPAGQHIEPRPEVLRAMDLLADRGIVNSLASRTDPAVERLVSGHPALAARLVAPQLGWGHKSEAVVRIADELGISVDSIAFVDDNAFERAEVAAVLPGVLVLGPEELLARLDSDPFRPDRITEDARQRVSRYREQERRRWAEQESAGRRDDFLHASGIVLALRRARPAELDRIVELIERTHRFNTTGERWSAERVAAVLDDPGWWVRVARLRDRYGDYGLIGTALVERGDDDAGGDDDGGGDAGGGGDESAPWRLRMLAVSCRAAGREVPTALLTRMMAAARAAGAAELLVDLRDTGANLELRMLLRRSGFRGARREDPDSGSVLLTRPLAGDLPETPKWLRIDEERDAPGWR